MKKITLAVIAALLMATGPAFAQQPFDRGVLSNAITKLRSPDPAEVRSSIRVLAASGSKTAVDPLTDLLRSGPSDEITNSALEALGTIGAPQSLDIIIEYLGHRRSDARIRALYALNRYDGKRVIRAIENALRDSVPEVRNTAAAILGERGSTSSVPILFLAFDRGVEQSAVAIGQIGSPEDSQRLTEYLGKADITLLLSGFFEFLHRPDFPQESKIEILNKLLTIAGPEVHSFYVAYRNSFPEGTDYDENMLFRTVDRLIRKVTGN